MKLFGKPTGDIREATSIYTVYLQSMAATSSEA